MDDFFKMMHPEEVIQENMNFLLSYYSEEYGKKFDPLLECRAKNAIYLFDSSPDITFQFLFNHQNEIDDWEYFSKIEEQAKDYIQVKKQVEEERDSVIYSLFCGSFGISPRDSFYGIDKVLKAIFEKNFEFLDISLSSTKLQEFLEKVEEEKKLANVKLISQSLWGKDLRQRLLRENGLNIDYYVLSILMYSRECSCYHFTGPSERQATFLCMSLIKEGYFGDLDRLFLHEFRHVLESGCCSIGIDFGKYTMLNEARTEKHAEFDNYALPTIFSKKIYRERIMMYEYLFPFTEEFLDDYSTVLDCCALLNDLDLLEDVFSSQALLEYNQKLRDIYFMIDDANKHGVKDLHFSYTPFQESITLLRKNASQYLNSEREKIFLKK